MKNKKTYYQIVLDRSGSMQDCKDVTISGFNEQLQLIQSLKEEFPDQEFFISLTIFNHRVEHLLQLADPSKAEPLTQEKFIPSGTTALYDAVGFAVTSLMGQVGTEIEKDEASAVVVILTDGHENASKVFDFNKVSSLIKELDAQDNWVFSYLGATMDAVEIAKGLNIRTSNAVKFEKSAMPQIWDRMGKSARAYNVRKRKKIVSKDYMVKDDED